MFIFLVKELSIELCPLPLSLTIVEYRVKLLCGYVL